MESRRNATEMMRRARRRVSSCAVATVLTLVPMTSSGQPSAREAEADRLFREGRELMDAKDFARACPRFAESQRVDPNTATLLNLAHCYERGGQLTRSWVTYRAAATLARSQGRRDRLETALARAGDVARGHATLRIIVTEPVPVPTVELDGIALPPPELGVPVPVESGEHRVAATAAGKRPWKQAVTVDAKGSVEVRVPALLDLPAPAPTAGVSPASVAPQPQRLPQAPVAPLTRWWSTQRTVGFTLAAVGGLAAGAGGVLGGVTLGMTDDIDAECPSRTACTARGVELNDRAHRFATASTALLVIGGALTGAGLTVMLTGDDELVTVAGRAGPQTASVELSTHW